MKAATVLKYPGSKWNLAKWIIEHMPPHTTYLEPFFGSGAVFFSKTPSKVETINDIDGNVVNLFKVIRDQPEELARLIEFTPWARDEYYASYERTGDQMEDARRFLVRCWQAFATDISAKTGWKNCKQGSRRAGYTSVWGGLPTRIMAVASRLSNAQIENKPALDVISEYRFQEVVIYADPPYPLKTRAGELYAHEMTDEEHIQLLGALDNHLGPVLLSGYASRLYSDRLKKWTQKTIKATAEGGREREEVLWLNPAATCGQVSLF